MPAFGVTVRSCRCRFCTVSLEAGELRISTKEMMGRNFIEAHHHWMCYLKHGRFKNPETIYGYNYLPEETRDAVNAFADEVHAKVEGKKEAKKAAAKAIVAAAKAAAKALVDAEKAKAKAAVLAEKAAAKAAALAAKAATKTPAKSELAGSKRPRSSAFPEPVSESPENIAPGVPVAAGL